MATRKVTAAAGDQPVRSRPFASAPDVPHAAEDRRIRSRPVTASLFIQDSGACPRAYAVTHARRECPVCNTGRHVQSGTVAEIRNPGFPGAAPRNGVPAGGSRGGTDGAP